MKELQKAVNILCKHLKNDKEYFYGWQANIAMSIYDEFLKRGSRDSHKTNREILNKGAINFLNRLINKKRK